MKVQSTFVALAVTCGMGVGGCSSTSETPPGAGGAGAGGKSSVGGASSAGTLGSSGSPSFGGAPSSTCTNVTACGGDVPGAWTVSSSCLELSGKLDLAAAGLDPQSCTSATVKGTLTVTGTFTANANGTYTDGTTTSGNTQFELAAGCLVISGTKINCQGAASAIEGGGFKNAMCTPSSSGGCSCTAVYTQTGGIGISSPTPVTSGNYMKDGNVLTLTTDGPNTNYSYCVSGGKLTLSPQTTAGTVTTGTIVLQSSSAGGSGGSGGAPSMGGSGGQAAGSGGAPPSGGAGGAGGASMGGKGGGAGSGGMGTGGGPGTGRVDGPCDIYAAASMPCAAAYSMVRALSKAYTGPLFQVRSGSSAMNTGSGGMLKDIGMTADGYADTAALEAYCMGTTCTVAKLYDQSGNENNLPVGKAGLSAGGMYSAMDDFESSATKGAVTAGGHKVYPLYMAAREGYRLQAVGKNMPRGSAAQGIYMIADGTHAGTACCWDFGNVTTNPKVYGVMNTLFFGKAFWGNGAGSGPWMMADFEAGVWAGGSKPGDPGWGALDDAHPSNPMNPSMAVPFAMGILKTQTSKYALRSADVKAATDLTTSFEGGLPKNMDNLGGIVLGVGGDNSNNSWGTFYEGAIVAGYPTVATDLAVLKNVQAVGYTK